MPHGQPPILTGSGARQREVSNDRRGFTLVELLVVIVIISMLMALLIPAVTAGRARARRTQCVNHQHELGLALLQYETAKKRLPGYVNYYGAPVRLAATPDENERNRSWVIMVFEQLGHGDLWRQWRDTSVPIADKVNPNDVANFAAVTVPELICPADFSGDSEVAPLSYVANCGLSDLSMLDADGNLDFSGNSNADDVADIQPVFTVPPLPPTPAANVRAAAAAQNPAYGLFFNHNGGTVGRTRVTLGGISDGAGQTVLISENIQASSWAPRLDSSGAPQATTQLDVGIVWWSTNPSAGYGVPAIGDGRMINDSRNVGSLPPLSVSNPRFFARPSSNHSGGAVVTFCDGSTDFVSEEVEYDVYQNLMTPSGEKAYANLLIPRP